jgi:D-amino peptidase
VVDYKLNGISIGEFGQFAMLGSFLGVNPIFGSGDLAFTQEASTLVPGIETVSVKRGIMPGSGNEHNTEGYRGRNNGAIHMHPEKARELIQRGAEKALCRFIQDRDAFPLLDIKAPFRKEVQFRSDGSKEEYSIVREHKDNLIQVMNMY